MSDRVHRTVRPTLPEGYQYGDAAKTPGRMLPLFIPTCFGFSVPIPTPWRAPHENAAAERRRHFAVKAPTCPLRGVCDSREIRWDGDIPYCAKCGVNWISGHGPHENAAGQRTGDETL